MSKTHTHATIDDGDVRAVLDAAEAHAAAEGLTVVIAVVERSGELIGMRRTAGAQIASSRVAVDKARTAAIFRRPSRELERQITDGRLGALALGGSRALTGGVPLVVGEEVVGGIGTSGETPDEDESVSQAGAAVALAVRRVPGLSFERARRAASAVASEARRRAISPVCAVVDAGGDLVYVWRPDAAQVASVTVAVDKARTAAIYRRPSRDFEEQAAGGRPSALHLARAVPLQGGHPLLSDGHVIGAVGVSGASSADEDHELSAIGSAALDGGDEAMHFHAEEVAERFVEGGLLHSTPNWALDAGRRDGPGEVECHLSTVDLMHVVQGTATVVCGGEMVDPRPVGVDELRSSAVDGGHPYELAPGDVLAIPAGVPHQFTEASTPFQYLVVKVAG